MIFFLLAYLHNSCCNVNLFTIKKSVWIYLSIYIGLLENDSYLILISKVSLLFNYWI